ncbi:unnamed protein product, partial [Larinioides sclopetarius]
IVQVFLGSYTGLIIELNEYAPLRIFPLVGDDDDDYPGRGDRPCDYDREVARNQKVIGNYIPQCEENGYYQKFQCINSAGECYCADADGDYLKAAEEPEDCE